MVSAAACTIHRRRRPGSEAGRPDSFLGPLRGNLWFRRPPRKTSRHDVRALRANSW